MDNKKYLKSPALRDIPTSFAEMHEAFIEQPKKEFSMFSKLLASHRKVIVENGDEFETTNESADEKDLPFKSQMQGKYWPIIATGTGLFSDGYINGSISTLSLCLSKIYGEKYSESHIIQNVSSIAFAGTVVGQLFFGYVADHYSRKIAMLTGTSCLILFTILCAGAWGVGTTSTEPGGLFAALTAYRFFLGIGIGSEYSSSSPAAAEAANSLPPGKRNRWFCWFTNLMINNGYLVNAVVPFILIWIFTPHHLNAVWRVTIGLGAIPPLSLFFIRLKYKENENFVRRKFNGKVPYWLIIKFYWFRTIIASLIWFLFDFSAYAFGTYSSIIINAILGNNKAIYKVFGWNIVFNMFYMPGCFFGAIVADYWGPRNTLTIGVLIQAVIGYVIAACFASLKRHIAAFVVAYGIFKTMGDFSAGNNIGLIASKIGASPVRAQIYGIAAAVGKVGAFVGSYVFPIIIRNNGGYDSVKGLQSPYWVASTFCVFTSFLAYFGLPAMDQEAMNKEDEKFMEYLKCSGYDTSQMGALEYEEKNVSLASSETTESKKLPQEAVQEIEIS